ncbi:MAG: hypothetical protein ACK4RG_02845 [Fimbriimonadales bacterium]
MSAHSRAFTLLLSAIAGGLLGAYLSAYRLMPNALNRALAIVLLIAYIKLALTLQ